MKKTRDHVPGAIDKCHPSDNTLVIKSTYYEYVFQILKRINYDAYNTGSTQPLITQKAISNIEIPLPPSNELDKFEKLVRQYILKFIRIIMK